MMKSVKINNKGMITIPARIRKKYNLTTGNEVLIYDMNGQIVIIPILDIEKIRTFTREEFGKVYEKIHDEEVKLEL